MVIEGAFDSGVQNCEAEASGLAVQKAEGEHCVPVREKMCVVSSISLCQI